MICLRVCYITTLYSKQNIHDNEKIDNKRFKYSEGPMIPNFPSGTSPPCNTSLKLVYLNIIARKSLDKDLNNL